MFVTIQNGPTPSTFTVAAPFHPDFPPHAGRLGGRWDGAVWRFDRRDMQAVRAALRAVFGEDGAEVPRVTVRVKAGLLDAFQCHQSAWVLGRKVATRPYRDSRVRFGVGVVVVAGTAGGSRGGSQKYPWLIFGEDTVLEVRDVPAPLAQAAVAQDAAHYEIVSD